MRTKDEILESARRDIQTRETKTDAPLWFEYRKLEVLIDIRDILFSQLNEDQERVLKRHQFN